MKSEELLKHSTHRQFDLPNRSWKFYQEWNKAIFLHWKIDSDEAINSYLPKGAILDKIDGNAWVSLVAFDMNNIGIRRFPKVPHISNFHEINIRTYIICKGKPSVYFLSMEGSKRSSCHILKALSKFPYRFSKMHRNTSSFISKNISLNDSFQIEFELDKTVPKKDKTDLWLTERYAVFQDYKKNLIEYDVHHLEWPMQHIKIKTLEVDYPKFKHIINNRPDKIHYSPGVQVLTWDKVKHRL